MVTFGDCWSLLVTVGTLNMHHLSTTPICPSRSQSLVVMVAPSQVTGLQKLLTKPPPCSKLPQLKTSSSARVLTSSEHLRLMKEKELQNRKQLYRNKNTRDREKRKQGFGQKRKRNVSGREKRKPSLVPRPFPPPVFDRLQYANTEGEGLGDLITCGYIR